MGANVELDIFLKKEGFSLQPILSLLKMEGLDISIQEMRVFDDWEYTNEMSIDTSAIDIKTSNIFLEKFTLIHFTVNNIWKCVLTASQIEDAYIDLSFGLNVTDLPKTDDNDIDDVDDVDASLTLFYDKAIDVINIHSNKEKLKDIFTAVSMGVEYSVHFNKNLFEMIEDDNGVERWVLPKDIGRNMSFKKFIKEEKSSVIVFTRF